MKRDFKIISWNVNGIRACFKKGLLSFIENNTPDILCLQEIKANLDQVPKEIINPLNMKSYWSSAKKKGYSGCATFSKQEALLHSKGIGKPEFDDEGRFSITSFEDFKVYNVYFPNGSSKKERQIYKMKFNNALLEKLKEELSNNVEIIVLGDFNIAPEEIDIYDPIRFSDVSGFLPEERQWLKRLNSLGFIDAFRHFYPDQKDIYSWWNMITRDRLSNKGWRIDLICVTKGLISRLESAKVMDTQLGSDHCPVEIGLKCY